MGTKTRSPGAGPSRLLRTLTGHTPRVCCVAFSPDGSLLASAGSSNQVGAFESGLAAPAVATVPAVVGGGAITILIAVSQSRMFPARVATSRTSNPHGCAQPDEL